jgi:hypothetical protein
MELLERLNRVRRSGSGWTAACPAHEDRTPSLTIGQGDDGTWLLTCHAGCTLDAVLSALGLEKRDLFPDRDEARSPRVEKVYSYTTFDVVRYSPKSFRQRRPDGQGGYVWNVRGVTPRVYRQDELTGQVTVGVVEGEKDADRLWSMDVPATTNPMGAGKWKRAHAQRLVEAGVKNVYVIADNDDPGRAHADKVAQSCFAAGLAVKCPRLPCDAKDISDWFDAGTTKDELFKLLRRTPAYVPTPGCETQIETDDNDALANVPIMTRLSDVASEAVDWVWQRRFARGKLTLVAGEPGTGKSTALTDLMARVSQGTAWPDGGYAPRGTVLLLSAEDGLGDTIRPKFDACGGDASRVHVLIAVRQIDGTERGLDLSRDLETLEVAIHQHAPVLVVIGHDPVS